MSNHFPDLKIERAADGCIILESVDMGNIDRVTIHPVHLRYLADTFGLGDTTTHKTIAALTRRLQLLNHRIQHLDNWLCNYSDSKHADLSYEQAYSGGTADMAEEFCAELMDVEPQGDTPTPAPSIPAKATVKGG